MVRNGRPGPPPWVPDARSPSLTRDGRIRFSVPHSVPPVTPDRYVRGMTEQTFTSYEEFWPYYVAMHSRAATRWVHLTGTLTGLAVSVYGLARGRKRYAAALPLIGYGAAWPAHFLIEKNNPATFGHPAWSLRGDVQMIRMMLAGRDGELAEIAAKWLAANR